MSPGTSASSGHPRSRGIRVFAPSRVPRPSASSRPALLPTPEVCPAHAGRKAEAAREPRLNRQTLHNRLGRISELLGTDLEDPRTVPALRLAPRARRHTPGE
ncbi:helix-turn-helix domain-containing protein [Streptomyces sp. NPDC059092]|uniref:helix-turn-helix domain-containing protein n=1 Tax=Streptomyces sp. NPDC059092 TaxID=3346725 RepID=UPI0036A28020